VVEYLSARGVDVDDAARENKTQSASWLFPTLGERMGEDQGDFHADFAAILTLATHGGVQTLLAEAVHAGLDIANAFAAQDGFISKAFWVFLTNRAVFDSAFRLSAKNYLSGRYWKRQLPIPGARSADFAERTDRLAEAIAAYFRSEEGRGLACRVDYLERSPQHHFFAYPEDYSARPMLWTGRGLEARSIRPAFEVVFVYDEQGQFLDVYVKGGKRVAEALWQVFARAMFDLDKLPPRAKPAYALDRLKDRHFVFVRPAGSPIVDVRLRKVRLALPGAEAARVSVEVDRDAAGALHRALDRLFPRADRRGDGFDLSLAKVIGATIAATIERRDGRTPLVRSFDVSPRTSSLKHEGDDLLLLRRMLRDSGIDAST
jgi:hypothetical protein